jgi:hypothetical protein
LDGENHPLPAVRIGRYEAESFNGHLQTVVAHSIGIGLNPDLAHKHISGAGSERPGALAQSQRVLKDAGPRSEIDTVPENRG